MFMRHPGDGSSSEFDGSAIRARPASVLPICPQKYDVPGGYPPFNGSSAQWVAGSTGFHSGVNDVPSRAGFVYGTAFPRRWMPFWSHRDGVRSDPFSGRQAFHGGVDLAAPPGQRLRLHTRALWNFSGWSGGYGNLIVVRHAFGYRHSTDTLSTDVRPGMGAMRAHGLRRWIYWASTGPHILRFGITERPSIRLDTQSPAPGSAGAAP